MNAKGFSCQIDGRSFKTAAALNQHTQSVHGPGGGVRAPNISTRTARNRRTRARRTANRAAGAGAASRPLASGGITGYTARQGGDPRVTGTDRLFTEDIPSAKLKAGALVMSVVIDNGISSRLAAVSQAFEKIRWNSLSFRVAAKGGSTVSGGYIAAFVPDPLDSQVDFSTILSHRGASSGKWWETRSVMGEVPNKDLYTSSSSGDLRLHSPGKLMVYSDGTPSASSVPLTIDVVWDVTFKSPGFERPQEVAPEFITSVACWTVANSEFLVPDKDAAPSETDAQAIMGFNPLKYDVSILKLPFPITAYTSDSTELAFYLYISSGKVAMYNDLQHKDPVKWLGKSTMVIPIETNLTPFSTPVPMTRPTETGMQFSGPMQEPEDFSRRLLKQLRELSLVLDRMELTSNPSPPSIASLASSAEFIRPTQQELGDPHL